MCRYKSGRLKAGSNGNNWEIGKISISRISVYHLAFLVPPSWIRLRGHMKLVISYNQSNTCTGLLAAQTQAVVRIISQY